MCLFIDIILFYNRKLQQFKFSHENRTVPKPLRGMSFWHKSKNRPSPKDKKKQKIVSKLDAKRLTKNQGNDICSRSFF